MATCACLVGVLVPGASAGAQTPPPCPAGVAVAPPLKAADSQDGNLAKNLTATHVIVVTAEFPEDGTVDDSTARWTTPAGVPVLTRRSRNADDIDLGGDNQVGLVPAAAGPLAVAVTWQQRDGAGGQCTASAGTTLQITAAKLLRPGIPRGSNTPNAREDREYTWSTRFGWDSDRRPLEVRVRSVRGAHLPGPRVPFKTFTIALRPTDPGWKADHRIVLPFLQVIGSYQGGITGFTQLLVGMRGVTANPRLGYDLMLRQGTRQVGRIRAAGSCSAFGCRFSTFILQR